MIDDSERMRMAYPSSKLYLPYLDLVSFECLNVQGCVRV